MDYYDDYGFEPEPEEQERDPKVDEAKPILLQFFSEHPTEVFYERQLQVIWEKKFFHWITADALHELLAERKVESEIIPLYDQVRIRFYWSPSNRYWKRKAARIKDLVLQYSDNNFLTALGIHGETMFDVALPRVGFMPVAINAREYRGRAWSKTSHTLDRILLRDQIAYGVEVKNTLDYIPHDELKTKLEMCETLQLRPLFIMRMAPKNYIWEVAQLGGFTLIFQYRLYPHGYKELAKQVKSELGLPVDCPKAISDGTVKRLLDWHLRHIPAAT